jgi:hypothetical protein
LSINELNTLLVVLGVGLGLVLVAIVIMFAIFQQRQRLREETKRGEVRAQVLRALGERFGLVPTGHSGIEGRIGEREIKMEFELYARHAYMAGWIALMKPVLPAEVSIEERASGPARYEGQGEGQYTGHHEFDERFWCDGLTENVKAIAVDIQTFLLGHWIDGVTHIDSKGVRFGRYFAELPWQVTSVVDVTVLLLEHWIGFCDRLEAVIS